MGVYFLFCWLVGCCKDGVGLLFWRKIVLRLLKVVFYLVNMKVLEKKLLKVNCCYFSFGFLIVCFFFGIWVVELSWFILGLVF